MRPQKSWGGTSGGSGALTYIKVGYISGSGSNTNIYCEVMDGITHINPGNVKTGINMYTSEYTSDLISEIQFGLPSNSSNNCTFKISVTRPCKLRTVNSGSQSETVTDLSVGQYTKTNIGTRINYLVYEES